MRNHHFGFPYFHRRFNAHNAESEGPDDNPADRLFPRTYIEQQRYVTIAACAPCSVACSYVQRCSAAQRVAVIGKAEKVAWHSHTHTHVKLTIDLGCRVAVRDTDSVDLRAGPSQRSGNDSRREMQLIVLKTFVLSPFLHAHTNNYSAWSMIVNGCTKIFCRTMMKRILILFVSRLKVNM